MKFKVFLSSRNNDPLTIDGGTYENMTQTRLFLKEELERERVLGEVFFDIRINEDFAADASKDSYQTCLDEVRGSDFCIAIVNGDSGWAPKGIDLGICHAELDTSMNISERKTAIIDVRAFYLIHPKDEEERERNELFEEYLKRHSRFTNPLKLQTSIRTQEGFRKTLLRSIKNILFNHLMQRIETSNIYYKLSANNPISLDWKKMKYFDRNKNILEILTKLIDHDEDLGFKKMKCIPSAIPDNMSVSDARAYTGRPFLKDHQLITLSQKERWGPIHFIAVYGNATEIQAKSLIGYPDVSVIHGDFGLYVWEQTEHIQLVFLTGCKTPEAVKSKYWLFRVWCGSTDELKNINRRAQARYHILSSILEAREIAKK